MITDKLDIKPEPSDSRYSYPHIGGAEDEAGSLETEVGEFLYGLVRMVKPTWILETGTYHGVSASYMADALKDNKLEIGHGGVVTLEYEPKNLEIAKELFKKLGVDPWIYAELVSSLDYVPGVMYDLMWLDTEPGIRFEELIKYYPHLKPGGYVFIHDLHPHMGQTNVEMNGMRNWPYGTLPEQIKNWLKDGELRPVHFRTPRGLTCLYRPGLDDYRWV
jgi:predicted O-methyltransferase YrrM